MRRGAWLLVAAAWVACPAKTLVGSSADMRFGNGADTRECRVEIGEADFTLTTLMECGRLADGKDFGMALSSPGGECVRLTLRPERSYDELYERCAWHVALTDGTVTLCDTLLRRDILDSTDRCVVALQRYRGRMGVVVNHTRLAEGSAVTHPFDTLTLFRTSGSRVQCAEVCVEVERPDDPEETPLGSVEAIDEHLAQSMDHVEGRWFLYGFTEDSNLLRKGGDYRLAIVRNGEGYDLVYLEGAKILPGSWTPGMVKGRMVRMPGTDVFRVTWLDAEHREMDRDIYAEMENGVVLNILFPRNNAQLTFRKEP